MHVLGITIITAGLRKLQEDKEARLTLYANMAPDICLASLSAPSDGLVYLYPAGRFRSTGIYAYGRSTVISFVNSLCGVCSGTRGVYRLKLTVFILCRGRAGVWDYGAFVCRTEELMIDWFIPFGLHAQYLDIIIAGSVTYTDVFKFE